MIVHNRLKTMDEIMSHVQANLSAQDSHTRQTAVGMEAYMYANMASLQVRIAFAWQMLTATQRMADAKVMFAHLEHANTHTAQARTGESAHPAI